MALRRVSSFLLAAVLCTTVNFSWGQSSYDLRHFDETHGLPSTYVVGMAESPDGRLLVATKGGVTLFDGVGFAPILVDSSAIDNVSAIGASASAVIMGLNDGNLLLWNGSQLENISTGMEQQIKFVAVAEELNILAIGRQGGLYRQKDGKDAVFTLLGDELLVNQAVLTQDGSILIATNEGLYMVSDAIDSESPVAVRCSAFPASRVVSLAISEADGRIVIGTEDTGLFSMAKEDSDDCSVRPVSISTDLQSIESSAILSDKDGRAWIGFANRGISVWSSNGTTGLKSLVTSFDHASLRQYMTTSIIEDSEGNIWASTFGGGLIQLVPRVFDNPFDEQWLRQQRITRLFRDNKGQIWLGIDKGIFLTDVDGTKSNYSYFHIGGGTVTSITQSVDGAIWVGTEGNGIHVKSQNTSQFRKVEFADAKLSEAINNIVPYGDKMHVCTKNGLYTVALNGKVLDHVNTSDGLPHNNVHHVLTDSNGNTWIANQGNRVSILKDGKARFLEGANAQNITDAYHIIEDRAGRLWFATQGAGVFVLDHGTAYHIGETEGLPSAFCYQLIEDDEGHIWVRHQKSITQLASDLSVLKVIGHQHLSPVSNTMITFLFKDETGNIWVTSTHGVVKYDPVIDKASRRIPKLSITGMRVDDNPVPLTEGLRLPYRKYSVAFTLSGISLRDPESILYKYQLLGFSDVWSEESSSNFIQFPRLEDGEYTLNVIASRNGGDWTPVPASYSFVIGKPFWRTWPFIAISLVALVAGVGGFIRFRTMKLTADKTELEHQVSLRTVEIQQQKEEIERSRDEIARYAKDITDSIKYAQRIQSAIFPDWDKSSDILPNSFVFFRSKDLVSGDFFFAERVGEKCIFAAVDCTGHGVPGGFMSIVANNLLNQAVKQMGLTRPSEILDYLNQGITNTLHQTYEESSVKDGLDIALCTLNLRTRKLEFSGAYNPLYIYRDDALTVYRGDRFPAGLFIGEEMKAFTNNEIQLQAGDMVYIFSDGYADQFGGPKGKKLKLHGFRDILNEIRTQPISDQGKILASKLDEWMGDLDQVDDIVVMGVRIT